MTVQVFVSYRRGDSPHAAGRLVDRLDEHFKLFIDVDRIRPGADFGSVVREAVDKTDVLVAVIGLRWLTLTADSGGRRIDQPGDWVAEEIGTALRRGTPVIPVLVDDAQMPSTDELPPALADLANRQALKISHESFSADSRRLIETIAAIVSSATPETVNLWDDPDYPQARGAFLQGHWPAAIEGFEQVLRRHPRLPHVVEQLEQARRSQQLLDLNASAENAAKAGRWQEVVDALKAIDVLEPSDDINERLSRAQLRLRINELQSDIRALAKTGNWAAVMAADIELARLDSGAADPEGLATKARAELLEAKLEASYGRAVKQLDDRDWAAAESTLVALLDQRPGYRDVGPLLALARRKGKPLETQEKTIRAAAPSTEAEPSPEKPPLGVGGLRRILAAVLAVVVLGLSVLVVIALLNRPEQTANPPVTSAAPTTSTSLVTPTPSPPPAPVPKWQRGTDLPEPLEAAGVTAFGDAVWVIGGNAPSASRPALDKVWFYQNGWRSGPRLPVRLDSMSVASDGKRLFVVGGRTTDSKGKNQKVSKDVLVLDGPDDDSWDALNRLPEERAGGAVAWHGQRLVFAGGVSPRDSNGNATAVNVNRADVWVWEGGEEWRVIGQLQEPREDLVAASDGNGRVWFLGGADDRGNDRRMPQGAVDLVQDDSITPLSDIDPVRSSSAVWLADRGVCLFGGVARATGAKKDSLSSKVACVPETASPSRTLRPLPPMTLPRAGMGAAVQGETIWLAGGFGPEQKDGQGRPGLSIVDVLK